MNRFWPTLLFLFPFVFCSCFSFSEQDKDSKQQGENKMEDIDLFDDTPLEISLETIDSKPV